MNTNLTGAHLKETLFTHTVFWDTVLADCHDLSLALDLATTEHDGPSSIDLRTLRSQIHLLPDPFLLGIGVGAEELIALRALYDELKPLEERPENAT